MKDQNQWRVFRQQLAGIGISDENTVDSIQGFVKTMLDARTKEWIDCRKCGDCVEVPIGKKVCFQCV